MSIGNPISSKGNVRTEATIANGKFLRCIVFIAPNITNMPMLKAGTLTRSGKIDPTVAVGSSIDNFHIHIDPHVARESSIIPEHKSKIPAINGLLILIHGL
jgi:hypothetical protein